MEELIASLKVAHANTFLMYYRALACHWNVVGSDFPEYHAFFNDLYDDLYGAVDPLAENIRKLNDFPPYSIKELYDHKTVKEASQTYVLTEMLEGLLEDNEEVIASLNKVFSLASKNNKQGLCNFLADRIDTHEKHDWMLRVSLKGTK